MASGNGAVTPEGKSLLKREPEPELDDDPNVVLEEEAVEDREAANPGAQDEEEKWLEKVEEEMGFEVRPGLQRNSGLGCSLDCSLV